MLLSPNFSLFRMVHLAFLYAYVLNAENAGWIQAQFPWIVVSIFPYVILDLHQKQVRHWKDFEIWSRNNMEILHLVFVFLQLKRHIHKQPVTYMTYALF